MGSIRFVNTYSYRDIHFYKVVCYMSNWTIDIENMTCFNKFINRIFKIEYRAEADSVYYYWTDGAYDGWSKCVSDITKEYHRQVEIEVERVLLKD